MFVSAKNSTLDEIKVEHEFISRYSSHIKSLFSMNGLTPTQILRCSRVRIDSFVSALKKIDFRLKEYRDFF